MVNKLKVLTKKRFKKTNFNAFLFFLFLAIVVWIFVQFSKQYSVIVKVPIDYVNVPPDKFIAPNNPEVLELRMEDSGFKIAWFSMFPPTFKIDVSKAEQTNGTLNYKMMDNRVAIQNQLDIDFETSQFLKKTLSIDYEQLEEKILPVSSQIEVDFAIGYAAADSIKLAVDSIKVSGPANILDTLNRLRTVALTLKNVKSDLSGTVAIDQSNLAHVNLYQKEVGYTLEVDKFTEGKVRVSLELINVPEGMNVVIFPKEVLLFFQVNLQDFNKVSASDFRVVCDFDEAGEGRGFLIPKVVQQPIFVTHLRLNENKIQFIIKK